MANQSSRRVSQSVEQLTIQRFKREIHENFVTLWLCLRDSSPGYVAELPRLGLIAYWGDTPTATIFLRICEGGVGIIEGLTTDPRVKSNKRHKALDVLVERILLEARHLGIEAILAYSVDAGTIERSFSHGFIELPHKLLVADLS